MFRIRLGDSVVLSEDEARQTTSMPRLSLLAVVDMRCRLQYAMLCSKTRSEVYRRRVVESYQQDKIQQKSEGSKG